MRSDDDDDEDLEPEGIAHFSCGEERREEGRGWWWWWGAEGILPDLPEVEMNRQIK